MLYRTNLGSRFYPTSLIHFQFFNGLASNEYLLRACYVSGLGGRDVERDMTKMRECTWHRTPGVGALPSADLGWNPGSYSSLLAAKSCLFEPFSSFVK